METIFEMNDSSIINFGRFKGRRLKDIPPRYFLYLINQIWIDEPRYAALKKYIKQNLEVLKREQFQANKY